MKIPLDLNKYQLFSLGGLLVVGFEFLAVALAVGGIFYWPLLLTFALGAGGLVFFLLYHNRAKLRSSGLLTATILTAVFLFFTLSSNEPTVFGGRDQGSFSEAAIRLAQNHRLPFETNASREFFALYGPGNALNFPGFNYTSDGKLVTHFSVGYVAWLAAFFTLFGLKGFALANGTSFLLFTVSFFLLLKLHVKKRTAFAGLFFLFSSFLFAWLVKLTLGENLALGLFWFGILQFSLFYKTKQAFCLFASLVAFFALTFTRLEAWALLLVVAAILFFKRRRLSTREWLRDKTYWWLGGIFLTLFLFSLQANSQFYRSSLKGLVRSFSPETAGSAFWPTFQMLMEVFFIFNLLTFLLLGGLGVLYLFKKKRYISLIPFFLTAPMLIYLFHPGISPDYPWLLRRYAFAVIPGAIFYAAIILDRLAPRMLFFFFSALLIGMNLSSSLPYFRFSENASLLSQTKKIAADFSDTDLILVDRLASGSGWSMLPGPLDFLFGKQAVYFFNPSDLDKLERENFSQIYFLIPNDNLNFYGELFSRHRLSPQKPYSLEMTQLETPSEKGNVVLPKKTTVETQGIIYRLED